MSIPLNHDGINGKSRSRTVLTNYRNGKMCAVLRDGGIAMSPDEDIQEYLDSGELSEYEEKCKRKFSVELWLKVVKKALARREKNIEARLALALKRASTSSSTSTIKRAKTSSKSPFDFPPELDDDSDTDTELEIDVGSGEE